MSLVLKIGIFALEEKRTEQKGGICRAGAAQGMEERAGAAPEETGFLLLS